MTRRIKFRRILPEHRKGRSLLWLIGVLMAVLWLLMYLRRISLT